MVSEGKLGAMQVVWYWVMRTALFLAVYAALWALKWFDIWAVVVAFVLAWMLSYIAFPRMRVRAQEQMDGWITRSNRGVTADAAAEDAQASALREGQVSDDE